MAIDEIVRVTAQIAPEGLPRREFGRTLYLYEIAPTATDAAAAKRNSEVRSYGGASAVAADYPNHAEINAAASIYFQQSPFPKNLMIGGWYKAEQKGLVLGGPITTTQAALRAAGTFTLTVGGKTTGNIDFTAVTNMAGAATLMQTAIAARHTGATVTVSGTNRFLITLGSAIDLSGDLFTTAEGAATPLGLTPETGVVIAQGYPAESVSAALTRIEGVDNSFYFVVTGDSIKDTSNITAVANWVAARRYMAAIETNAAGAIDASDTSSEIYGLSQLQQNRVFGVWSRTADHKALSLAGRFSSVNFRAPASLITGKFKDCPGTLADNVTLTEKNALDAKRLNVYRNYGGDTFLVEGWSFGTWIDVQYALDWLVDAMQVEVFNLLRQSPARVPQTSRGAAAIQDVVEAVLESAVLNGTLAPGQLSPALRLDVINATGSEDFDGFLDSGYLVNIGEFALQSQADRNARMAPPVRVWAKGSGAVHFVDVNIVFEN